MKITFYCFLPFFWNIFKIQHLLNTQQLNPAAVSTLTLIDEPLFGFALLFSLVVQSHISSKVLCYRSLQSMMNHISTVYSDYSITLAVIIFNLALIVAIDPHALSSWSLVFALLCSRGPRGSALLLSAPQLLGLNGLTWPRSTNLDQ